MHKWPVSDWAQCPDCGHEQYWAKLPDDGYATHIGPCEACGEEKSFTLMTCPECYKKVGSLPGTAMGHYGAKSVCVDCAHPMKTKEEIEVQYKKWLEFTPDAAHMYHGGTWKDQNCIKCGRQHYIDQDWRVHPGWKRPCTVPTWLYYAERDRVYQYLVRFHKTHGYHISDYHKVKNGYRVLYHNPGGMPYDETYNDPPFQGQLICALWHRKEK